ncbi:hypothetical protein PPERSA_06807 [Pseudocohnilembus persalinus]|uniref:Uncharacterized protein n=1 Tax=Pseudocohnilembus persalinus TaxID=266149 RepID=A0A0V0QTE1_PSEPJ|nr:hypothetical protein PPERSA_06807 [Pseudocohnilembus persalinus]|eukprot:KRX05173.1 hypothetical protein PPERSA_06807 [Pseudocohnilembus persalinus]
MISFPEYSISPRVHYHQVNPSYICNPISTNHSLQIINPQIRQQQYKNNYLSLTPGRSSHIINRTISPQRVAPPSPRVQQYNKCNIHNNTVRKQQQHQQQKQQYQQQQLNQSIQPSQNNSVQYQTIPRQQTLSPSLSKSPPMRQTVLIQQDKSRLSPVKFDKENEQLQRKSSFLADQYKRIEDLNKREKEQQQEIVRLNTNLEIKNSEIFSLKKVISKLENQVNEGYLKQKDLRDSNDFEAQRLKNTINQNNKQISQLKQEILELQNANFIWEQNYEKMEKSFNQATESANQRIKSQNEAIISYQEKIDELNSKNQQLENMNQNILNENKDLNQALEDQDIQLKAFTRDSITPNDKKYYEELLVKANMEIKELRDCNFQLNKEKFEYRTQLGQMKNEIENARNLQNDYQLKVNTLNKMEKQNYLLKTENQRLNNILVGRCREMRNNWQ